ncbi:hypothetical protein DPMN_129083 [Dreissena polymorpha]|uniref:Uncharacterized protein n=1 Tax=Dreissena polymorpha TaxID=45954 RepID=A0A9D4H0K9_DREPO|nr:hypothetical protein DPMN_129083 [Dreissena polymorpha]
MVTVRRWIVVSLHRRKWDGSSGGCNVEDGRVDPWADIQARISRDCSLKVMEVSQDGGTQYAQPAGETVLGFGSTVCGV